MKKVGDQTWEVTEPTPIEIGKPATPPSDEAIAALRTAVAAAGATRILWFWVSIDGDRPHLGLAVAPADDAIAARVGSAVEPLWQQHSPANPVFDVLRLGDPEIDRLIAQHGQVLYDASADTPP